MKEIPTVDEWLNVAPWRDRSVSLLHLDNLIQGDNLSDKRALASMPAERLIVLWTGRYKTDARRITPDELAVIRERLA